MTKTPEPEGQQTTDYLGRAERDYQAASGLISAGQTQDAAVRLQAATVAINLHMIQQQDRHAAFQRMIMAAKAKADGVRLKSVEA